jgi:hypothetical protein
MRKIIFTLVGFFMLSSTVLANSDLKVNWVSVGGEYGTSTNTKTQRDSSSLGVSFLVGLSNDIVIEARNRTQQTDSTSNSAKSAPRSWQEVGASKRFNVGITNVYGRGLIGIHSNTGVRYAYSAGEIGITDQFGKSPFGYTIGYRWTDSLNNREINNAQNEQKRVQIHYNINKNHRVQVRYQEQRGDTPTNALNFGYSYRF